MRSTILMMMVATIGVATIAHGQAPFAVDPTFVTTINQQGVSSIALLDDGDILVSGRMRFGTSETNWLLARLNPDGTRDTDWPSITPPGGGKIVPWSEQAYVAVGQGVKRVWLNGLTDFGFEEINLDPYIQLLQGGDYHVFPDGRLLITGTHGLSDTVRGYVGLYNLIWITAEGRLDTTRVHRRCNGVLDTIDQLADGTFLVGGGMTEYEGHPVGNIIHVFADGSLDTNYQTSVVWNWPACFYPLPDGKVLCGGNLLFEGIADTLHLVRLNADGSLDDTFNNHLDAVRTYDLDGKAAITSITPLGADRYIITGFWDQVEGEPRGGIALVDTSGQLLDDLFAGGGCGTYWDGFSTLGGINGITEAPDGSYYIYGYYHGYDDGTTDDGSQRMVSRLYGLDVGVEESGAVQGGGLVVFPDPASDQVSLSLELPPFGGGTVEGQVQVQLLDALGRTVHIDNYQVERSRDLHAIRGTINVSALPPGTYYLHLRDAKRWLAGGKVMIQR